MRGRTDQEQEEKVMASLRSQFMIHNCILKD